MSASGARESSGGQPTACARGSGGAWLGSGVSSPRVPWSSCLACSRSRRKMSVARLVRSDSATTTSLLTRRSEASTLQQVEFHVKHRGPENSKGAHSTSSAKSAELGRRLPRGPDPPNWCALTVGGAGPRSEGRPVDDGSVSSFGRSVEEVRPGYAIGMAIDGRCIRESRLLPFT